VKGVRGPHGPRPPVVRRRPSIVARVPNGPGAGRATPFEATFTPAVRWPCVAQPAGLRSGVERCGAFFRDPSARTLIPTLHKSGRASALQMDEWLRPERW
jgi:hypothetical protein